MRYRVLLSHHVLTVSPLLELSLAASPSAADLTNYTLKLEATYSKVRQSSRLTGCHGWTCVCGMQAHCAPCATCASQWGQQDRSVYCCRLSVCWKMQILNIHP